MKISQKALADLLHKYFTTLIPVATDVTLKVEKGKPVKGDAYIPKDLSNSMSKAIAKAIHPNLPGSISVYRKSTTSVTASGFISPTFSPTFLTALETSIKTNEGDFAQVHVGTHDVEQTAIVIAQMYLGFTLDGVTSAENVKNVHAYLVDGRVDFPMSLTWTIGPLSAGTHIIRPYCAKYLTTDNNWSCRWPFCHILVFSGTEVSG